MPATLQRPQPFRRPRFRRVEEPPPFQLTARDVAILHAVARYRFLSSTLIIRLIGGSQQQILRRLQLLFHHGYLDRPTSQIAQLAHAFDLGNRPFVYGLGRAGAQVLAEAGIPLKEKLDWTTKNSRATAQFLAHTIETAETMIAFELACRDEGAPELIDHHDLLPYLPEETRDDDAPFHVRVELKTAREALTIGVIPDRVFSLAFTDRTRLNFALELDRGTMDIKSRQLVGKSSFRRKLLGYYQLWREGLHTTQWGFKAFRVLTVTPSETRIENMIAAQKRNRGRARLQSLSVHDAPSPQREVAACRCVGHRQGRRDGSRIMTAHRAHEHLRHLSAGSSFGWPDSGAGAALSRARFALHRAASGSASLDSAVSSPRDFHSHTNEELRSFDKV